MFKVSFLASLASIVFQRHPNPLHSFSADIHTSIICLLLFDNVQAIEGAYHMLKLLDGICIVHDYIHE